MMPFYQKEEKIQIQPPPLKEVVNIADNLVTFLSKTIKNDDKEITEYFSIRRAIYDYIVE